VARGWESKEIESQIEAAETRAAENAKPRLTPEQVAREREIDSLNLSRTRVLQDLENSTNPRYREMLERSLAFLDEKITLLQLSDIAKS
jgi:molecular chaperone DnaK (HSP70)